MTSQRRRYEPAITPESQAAYDARQAELAELEDYEHADSAKYMFSSGAADPLKGGDRRLHVAQGFCDFSSTRPHTRTYACVNWRPV